MRSLCFKIKVTEVQQRDKGKYEYVLPCKSYKTQKRKFLMSNKRIKKNDV